MSDELRELFPAAYTTHRRVNHSTGDIEHMQGRRRQTPRALSTRTRMILTMEMRGFSQQDIARRLEMTSGSVWRIVNTERYRAHRDHYLERMDAELLAMKPLAFTALRNGLTDTDQNTALRASEQWMKAAGFMHYGQRGAGQGNAAVTAEDVAAQLLQNVNIQVNVTVPTTVKKDE